MSHCKTIQSTNRSARCSSIILALLHGAFILSVIGMDSAHAEDTCTNTRPYKQLAHRALKKYNHMKKLFDEERKYISYINAPGTPNYQKWSDPDMAFEYAHDDFVKNIQPIQLNCSTASITRSVVQYSSAIDAIMIAERQLTQARDDLVSSDITPTIDYEATLKDSEVSIAEANKIMRSESGR